MPHNEAFARDFIHNKVPLFLDKEKDGAIELGANHGIYTKVIAPHVELLYAFEPHPDNMKKLEQVVYVDNSLENVCVCEYAATDVMDTIKFFDCSVNQGGHTMIEAIASPKNLGHDPDRYIEVDGIPLDKYFSYDETSPIDNCFRFMKIDIEGAEYHALKGAKNLLRCNDMMILLETHIKIDCKGLYDLVTGLGYEVYNDKFEKVDHVVEDAHYVLTNIGLSPIGM